MKKCLIVFLAVLVTGAAVLGLLLRHNVEPLHKGKSISYWVDHKQQYREVREIGAPAVPYLIARLRTRDTWWRTGRNKLRRLLPLKIRARIPEYESASQIQCRAANGLALLGPGARAATKDLASLVDKEKLVAWTALQALAAIGPDAKQVLPQISYGWRSRDPVVQVKTALALWRIGGETNLTLEILTNSLVSGKQGCWHASVALGEMGKAAGPSVPELLHLLRGETYDSALRGISAYALGQIGIANDEIISALLLGIEDPNMDVKGNSATALWQLDPRYVQMVAPIVVRFAVELDWTSFVRFAKRHQLDLKPAVPAMRDLLQNEDPQIRKFAAGALAEAGVSTTVESKPNK